MGVETDSRLLSHSKISGSCSLIDFTSACTEVERLIHELERCLDDLDVNGLNDRQILGPEILAFLSSPQGEEFGDNLRHETFSRLNVAQKKEKSLREEMVVAEEDLRIASTIFCFVESITCRIRHTRTAPRP